MNIRNITAFYTVSLLLWSCLFCDTINSQNETSKWYFGPYSGLDFTTNPPTTMTNSAMFISERQSSCVADVSGNLLFYTDGRTVWNQAHAIMANGQFLLGDAITRQTSLIVKQPSSNNLYYIFTIADNALGLYYSIVDMSLAAGMGSVTVKNASLCTTNVSILISSARHCNGTDVWVVVRDGYYVGSTFNFKSYLLTSTGVSTLAVSSQSLGNQTWNGTMKISPNGTKLGVVTYGGNSVTYLCDFDNSTGVVSNPISLFPSSNPSFYGDGCEFSPDGTKFYTSTHSNFGIRQWDLCAGSNTAIAASMSSFSVFLGSTNLLTGPIQLALDGKIYVGGTSPLGVINNPNNAGTACNPGIGPVVNSSHSIPNFMGSYFLQQPTSPPITSSVNTVAGCKTVSFTAPPQPSVYCAAAGYSITNLLWDFGEPSSGSSNTSTLTNPLHAYANTGTYTTQLILYYSCGGGTDTLQKVITIVQPTLSVNNNAVTCAAAGSATVSVNGGIGPFTYSWAPSLQTGSVSSVLSPGNHTITVYDTGAGCTTTITTSLTTNYVLTGNISTTSVMCNGANTGSASLLVSGGTGNYGYVWNGSAQTTSNAIGLLAGIYTVIATDLSGPPPCVFSQTLQINEPPIFVLNVAASTASNCVGNSILLSASGSGGTPAYTYTWVGGPVNTSYSVAQTTTGYYQYTVNAIDANNCTVSNSITVYFSNAPLLTVSNATICSGYSASLTISGADTYTWYPSGFVGSTFTANPSSTTSYSVSGYLTGCTSTNQAIATISVVPPPSLTVALSSGSLCSQAFNGSPNTITLTAAGANTYSLVTVPDMSISNPNGPVSQLSAIPPNTGIASGTLSGSNGVCTVTASLTFSIIPNPTVTISSPTPVICAGETYTYTNQGASSYTWTSATPGFTSYNNGGVAVANPSINSVFSVFGGSLGCNSASKISSITVMPLPMIHLGPETPTVCIGSKLTLSAAGTANSYTWAPYTSINSMYGNTVQAYPSSQQTYTVIGSLNSCTSMALITVSLVPLPNPSIQVLNPKACMNETITMQGFGGEYYKWNGPNAFFNEGQTIRFKAGSPFYAGIYTLTAIDKNNCQANTNTEITLYNLPSGNLKGRMSGCVPLHSEFNFQSAKDVEVVWQLNHKTITTKNFSNDFVIPGTYTITGRYTDTLTQCKNTGSFVVNAYPVPIADFTYLPEKPIENLDQVIFINTSKGDEQTNWDWYFINNQGYHTDNKHANYLFTEVGTYPIAMMVTNTWGCADTVVKAIKVEPDLSVYVPNVFTPNDDGLNDVFLPITRAIKFYELLIFDRWGALVFSSTNLEEGWDGTYRGEPCKVDVYVWKINLSSVNGEMKTMTGSVTLSR